MKTYISIFIVLAVCLGIFYIGRNAHLKALSERYASVVAIEEKDLSYRSKQLPMLGGGILFYQVRFKDLKFDHCVDKISLTVTKDEVKITLNGVRFHIDDALKSKTNLEDTLRTYIPYKHVFTRPLETLALAGVEEINFDAQFSLKKDGLSRRILGQAHDKKLGRVLFDFYIPIEMNKLSPSELAQATLLDGTFSFEDIAVADKYRAYAATLGVKEPLNWMSGVTIK